MILDSLLAFGVLLSTATQLRFGDTPFGPGEMCLAIWFGLFLCLQIRRPAPVPNAALTRVVTFWLILIVAESVGAIVGFATELFFDTTHMIHDVIAYFFLLDITGLIFLARESVITSDMLSLAAISLPITALGVWLGGRRFLGATPDSFRRTTLLMLMGIAAIGIVRGLWVLS